MSCVHVSLRSLTVAARIPTKQIKRERETKRKNIYVYIFVFVYVFVRRERERERAFAAGRSASPATSRGTMPIVIAEVMSARNATDKGSNDYHLTRFILADNLPE